MGPVPGSSVILLARPVDVVEQRDGEGHAQQLRRRKERVKRWRQTRLPPLCDASDVDALGAVGFSDVLHILWRRRRP